MRWSVVGAAVAAAVLGACGGGGSSDGGDTVCTPTDQKTMTLTSAGVTPKAQCVLPGGTVSFVNNDTVAHEIGGEGGCMESVAIPAGPGTRGSSTFGASLGTCNFHDNQNPTNAAFQGSVTVANAPATGPGY